MDWKPRHDLGAIARRFQIYGEFLKAEPYGSGHINDTYCAVMTGLALHDLGDMVRTSTSPAPEDERDLSKVKMQFPMFEALTRGYIESASGFLTKSERQHLAFSGKLITFEIGVRFLTDFLAGDTYFKVHRENHNLDRCRTQFALVESIEQQEEKMTKLAEAL